MREPDGKYNELLADCFAGNWAAGAYYRGYVQGQDRFVEAVGALEAIGDHEYFSPGHRGTPEERQKAFLLGFLGGEGGILAAPVTCMRYYWITHN